MKKSKFIGLALALFSAFALTGCNSQPVVGPQGPQGETGETGPQGPQGSAGQDGKDGVNGQDGNGIVSIELTDSSGNIDTYTITFDNGETTTFTVTNGENGEQGIQGEPGEDGHTPVIEIGDNGNWFIDGVDTGVSSKGEPGEKGDTGEQGPQGEPGMDGIDGTSIYTLNGEPSSDLGKNGDSYIDLLSWNFYVKENGEWVLKGNIKGADGSDGQKGETGDDGVDGEDGLSAYEIYIKYHPEYTGTEEEWINDLESGKLRVITINFDSNGGSEVDSIITNFGSYITVTEPTRNGYDFVGWSLNGSLIDINTYVFFADCTLVAQWEESEYISLSLNANGGVVVPGILEVKYGDEYSLPTPSKAYQTFDAWTYEGQEIPTTGIWNYTHNDIELVAQWNTSNVYVDLEVDSEYGSVDLSRVTLTIGDYYSLPIPTSIKEGYAFNGWYLGDEKITDAEGNSLQICDFTETTTLRASYFIEIATIYDFMELGGQSLNGNYLITNDLDFKGLAVNQIGSLNGTLDGGGHTLSNFVLSTDAEGSSTTTSTLNTYSGLIKSLGSDSKINNICFDNVSCFEPCSSGIVGTMRNNAVLENIKISNSFNDVAMRSLLVGTAIGTILEYPDNFKDAPKYEGNVYINNIEINNSGNNCLSFGLFTTEQTYYKHSDGASNPYYMWPSVHIDGFIVNNVDNHNADSCGLIYALPTAHNKSYSSNNEVVSIKDFKFNGNVSYGLINFADDYTSEYKEISVNNAEINGNTNVAWSNATTLTDALLNGRTNSWGAEQSLRCIDTKNDLSQLEIENVFSSIFLYPDANGVYSYFSAEGELLTFNDASLIDKNLFVSLFGFSEETWDLDTIDIGNGLYPHIR